MYIQKRNRLTKTENKLVVTKSACVLRHSVLSDSLQLMDYSLPGSSAMAFSRQEYWSGLPFPSPGHLPEPGIEPASPALAAGCFITAPPGKPKGGDRVCVCVANYRLDRGMELEPINYYI